MKIHELLRESNIQEVVVKRMPKFLDSNKVGEGGDAQVYAAKTNSVIKVTDYYDSHNDPIYQYVDTVMSNQDNPFFPKIYSAKVYTTPETKDKYLKGKLVVTMEKLFPFGGEKTAHFLPQLLKQMGISENDIDSSGEFGNQAYLTAKKTIDVERSHASDDRDSDASDRGNMTHHLGDILAKLFKTTEGRKKLMQQSKSPELKQALTLTHDIIERLKNDPERQAAGDLHQENIMYRLTNVGPQLVIVDPIVGWWV